MHADISTLFEFSSSNAFSGVCILWSGSRFKIAWKEVQKWIYKCQDYLQLYENFCKFVVKSKIITYK